MDADLDDLLRTGNAPWLDEILSVQQINGNAPNLFVVSLIPAAHLFYMLINNY